MLCLLPDGGIRGEARFLSALRGKVDGMADEDARYQAFLFMADGTVLDERLQIQAT